VKHLTYDTKPVYHTTIHFSFGYTQGGGIHKQHTLTDATNLEQDIFKVVNVLSLNLQVTSSINSCITIFASLN
jgi:hypothetical protein